MPDPQFRTDEHLEGLYDIIWAAVLQGDGNCVAQRRLFRGSLVNRKNFHCYNPLLDVALERRSEINRDKFSRARSRAFLPYLNSHEKWRSTFCCIRTVTTFPNIDLSLGRPPGTAKVNYGRIHCTVISLV